MRLTLFHLCTTLLFCGQLMGVTEQVVAEAEKTGNSVPESSVAILFAGLLWFLLLRKRA